KAYEISYALFRVAGVAKSHEISKAIERFGVELFESTVDRKWGAVLLTIGKTNYFLRLGRDVGAIGHSNVSVLEHELSRFCASIEELQKTSDELPDLDLNSHFSDSPSVPTQKYPRGVSGIRDGQNRQTTRRGAGFGEAPADQSAGQKERQDVILSRVKELNICKTKDIQIALPNVSERTLRYDLQKLLELGQVERVGSGGPATFYRAKESGTTLAGGSVSSR
ncbi:MAG: DeoR family transcriptional regulator, partial [Patescibacteria group bacterium]